MRVTVVVVCSLFYDIPVASFGQTNTKNAFLTNKHTSLVLLFQSVTPELIHKTPTNGKNKQGDRPSFSQQQRWWPTDDQQHPAKSFRNQ